MKVTVLTPKFQNSLFLLCVAAISWSGMMRTASGAGGRGAAVVVSVGGYKHLEPLNSAPHDIALMVENLLVAGFQPQDIFVLSDVADSAIRNLISARGRARYPVDSQPFVPRPFSGDPVTEKEEVQDVVKATTARAHSEGMKFLVVYLSGHGVAYKDQRLLRGKGQRHFALPSSRAGRVDGWLSVTQLENVIEASSTDTSTTHNLLIVDACAPTVPVENVWSPSDDFSRIYEMYSTSLGHFSYVDERTSTSVFTRILSYALVGEREDGDVITPFADADGKIRLSDVSAYVHVQFEEPSWIGRVRDAARAAGYVPNDPILSQSPDWHVDPIVFFERGQ